MTDLEQDAYVYPGPRIAQNGMVLGQDQGMTLLDWFAGQALAGDMANSARSWANATLDEYMIDRARLFYRIADAMMEARK